MEDEDIEHLATSIRRCFRLSRDGRVAEEKRREYQRQGIRLREKLTSLLAAEFDSGTQQYQDASGRLREVSDRLRDETKAIDQAVDTIAAITALIGVLDILLDVATAIA